MVLHSISSSNSSGTIVAWPTRFCLILFLSTVLLAHTLTHTFLMALCPGLPG